MRSSNLGDHDTRRVSGFAEWRYAPGVSTQLDAGLRVDRYTEFGTAWSPSLGVGWWPSAAVRLRASAGRAFRVPTFTERYYSDPANWARPEVHAETAWAGETGADFFPASGWMVTANGLRPLDHDVIDGLRPTTAERLRNLQHPRVDTVGAESPPGTLPDGSFIQAGYTGSMMSDGAPSRALQVLPGLRAPQRGRGRRRLFCRQPCNWRPSRVQASTRSQRGRAITRCSDLRVSRRFGIYEVRLEGTNLGNAVYQEVLGVAHAGPLRGGCHWLLSLMCDGAIVR